MGTTMDVITAKLRRKRQNSELKFGKLAYLMGGLFSLSAASASEWQIKPTLDLTETYSDNLRLAIKGKEEIAFITQVSPGIDINTKGPRLQLQANYVLQKSFYAGDQHDTRTNNLLRTNGKLAVIDELFYIDGRANITQQNLTPFGRVADANFNLIDERAEVRTWGVSPFLRKNFQNQYTGEVRYVRDSVSSSAQRNADSQSDLFRLSLTSGTAFNSFEWGVNYSKQNIHYERQAALETQTATSNLGFRVTPLFKLTTTAGYEKSSYASLGAKPEGFFWTAGFAWTPTERTNFTATAGHRFFGSTYSLALSQRARTSVWNLGYNEDVTTTRGQFSLPATGNTQNFLDQLWQSIIPDKDARKQIVDNFIRDAGLPLSLAQPINTFTNQVFLQKNLQASVALTGVQNTAVLNLYNNTREVLSRGGLESSVNPGLSNNVKQVGINALWNLKFSPRTNATMNVAYSRNNSVNTNVKDFNKTFRASITRQLQPISRVTLEFRHVTKDSNLTIGNYDENAITLYLLLSL